MNRRIAGLLLLCAVLPAGAQRVLSLDSCRQMALRNNKQLGVSRLKQDVAANLRRAARTRYLPHVNAIGTYEHTSEEISILSNAQKAALGSIGTSYASAMQEGIGGMLSQFPQPQLAEALGKLGLSMEAVQQMIGQNLTTTAGQLNTEGQKIVDAFRTDTRNIWAGSVLLTQPIFMGGSIIAMNKMADINEEMAGNSFEARRQATLYSIDQAYWQVVSLRHKKKLAEGYLDLIKKLDSDVQKMIDEGVATRSDGLSVNVKVNEAEMTLSKVNDGLVLSKMLLCQLCGLPLNEEVTLTDENGESIASVELTAMPDVEQAAEHRPELRVLQNVVDMSKQATNILRAGNLPQVALMGGYAVSNPNVLNGF
ncbi:MAG: TolC family protein, partial [Prevotella sp.]|nr:TolC family protein [Prevotella sp.]